MNKSGILIISVKGAGKTTLARKFLEGKENIIAYLSASEAAGLINRQLKAGEINTASADFYKNDKNHNLIQQTFFQYLDSKPQEYFIYDGHVVHEDQNEYYPIGLEIHSYRPIQAVIMVEATANEILEHRLNDKEKLRPQRPENEIKLIQEMNREQGQLLANKSNIPFYTVPTGDQKAFSKIVIQSLGLTEKISP